MKKLVIADAARRDLKEIGRYTERVWGGEQKRRYLAELRGRMADLRRNPYLGAKRDPIRPGYRSLKCESHLIFYRVTQNAIEIIRVLHQRMDVRRHLLRRGNAAILENGGDADRES